MRKILFIILFLIIPISAFSAESRGTIIDYRPLENNDTLKVTRWYGDWWFGAAGGPVYNQYLGSFYLPFQPNVRPSEEINPEYELSGGNGLGFSIGAFAEYNPSDSPHGGILKVSYLQHTYNALTEEISAIDNKKIGIESNLNFLNIMSAYRYDFPIFNLYAMAGPGIELFLSQDSKHFKQFKNSGNIRERNKLELNNVKTRIYFHIGVGLDLLLMDLGNSRMRFSPYASIDFGNQILEKQDFGLNDVSTKVSQLKIGIALKIGPDNSMIDTLKFDPNYRGPEYKEEEITQNIDLGNNLNNSLLAASDIGYIPIPEPIEIVREEPNLQKPKNKNKENFKKVNINTNEMEIFTYPTPSATGFTPELEEYMNSLATFLKENPGSEIRVIGHSDNLGTPEQNQRRSVIRKDKIVRYLLSKGIDRYRILDRGEGDRRPIADNRTAAGRKKNRRVEITVVQ